MAKQKKTKRIDKDKKQNIGSSSFVRMINQTSSDIIYARVED